MATGVGLLIALALVIGTLLARASARLQADDSSEVERINALLPQTQCGQCGFPGCRPYAEALLTGSAEIDQCPPGGAATARALGELLGNRDLGHMPGAPAASVAFIDEPACIGCTRCVEVCPVDAIIGAAQFTHTVIAADCTGCELCIPVCPVDCIRLQMQPAAMAGSRQA
jgi:electron transport complex protein RnfB